MHGSDFQSFGSQSFFLSCEKDNHHVCGFPRFHAVRRQDGQNPIHEKQLEQALFERAALIFRHSTVHSRELIGAQPTLFERSQSAELHTCVHPLTHWASNQEPGEDRNEQSRMQTRGATRFLILEVDPSAVVSFNWVCFASQDSDLNAG
jgi:hypothetical protein